MNLSNTSEYAIRMMLYMALNPDHLVTTRELENNLKLPFKYIGHLLKELTNAGLIRSKRGKYGGYKLGKEPDKITLLEIVRVVDDWDKYTGCMLGFGECNDENPCAFHDIWAPVRTKIENTFAFSNLQDLMEHRHSKV